MNPAHYPWLALPTLLLATLPISDLNHAATSPSAQSKPYPKRASLQHAAPSAALTAAQKRPNIVLIMADDMGFSDIGCFGGDIETPNIDRLAAEGLSFTHFTNAARCCPTRASLMTGLYPTQAGVGDMNYNLGNAAYQGELNNHCVTLAEVLKGAGYATAMTGKWHLTQFAHNTATSAQGQQNWPRQRGFDHYYGVIAGQANYFHPETLTLENQRLAPPGAGFYTTDAFSDDTVKTIENHDKIKPFFCYVAYNAPHWPLMAKPADLAKYNHRFDAGWDVLRQKRYDRMIKMGIIAPGWELSPRPQPWDAATDKAVLLRKMETYAAMVDSMDQGIGRIVAALKKSGQYDNTLLLFLSDNGACHETPSYGVPWANLSNTPFRLYKHWTTEGGIATPLIVHWPGGIRAHGQKRAQFGNIMDIMATLVDVAGATYPKTYRGESIPAMEGVSLMPAFENRALQRAAPIYWEHEGNRAVIAGDYKLVSTGTRRQPAHWELYNLAADRSENHDLAATQPQRASQMAQSWDAWAARVHVLPYPPQTGSEISGEDAPVSNPAASIPTPQIANRELLISCDVTLAANATNAAAAPQNGVILAQGGERQGYALYFEAGKLVFGVRENGTLTTISAPAAPVGKFLIQARLQSGGAMTLSVNGIIAARGAAAGLIPAQPKDDLSLGADTRAAVGLYTAPNPLVGTVENVVVTPENPA